AVLRSPRLAAVAGAVHTAGGDGDVHSLLVARIGDDGVEREAAVAGQPARAVRMIEERAVQGPCFAGVAAFEEGRGFDAAVERVGLVVAAGCNLPDVLQRRAGVGGKAYGRFGRVRPALAEVVAGTQGGAPEALRGGPDALAPAALVIRESKDVIAMEVGAAEFPAAAFLTRAQDEEAFHGSDEQQKIAAAEADVTNGMQNRGPGATAVGAEIVGENRGRLHGLESSLHFAGTLIALRRFLR